MGRFFAQVPLKTRRRREGEMTDGCGRCTVRPREDDNPESLSCEIQAMALKRSAEEQGPQSTATVATP